jgi:hypothetical protein
MAHAKPAQDNTRREVWPLGGGAILIENISRQTFFYIATVSPGIAHWGDQ